MRSRSFQLIFLNAAPPFINGNGEAVQEASKQKKNKTITTAIFFSTRAPRSMPKQKQLPGRTRARLNELMSQVSPSHTWSYGVATAASRCDRIMPCWLTSLPQLTHPACTVIVRVDRSWSATGSVQFELNEPSRIGNRCRMQEEN